MSEEFQSVETAEPSGGGEPLGASERRAERQASFDAFEPSIATREAMESNADRRDILKKYVGALEDSTTINSAWEQSEHHRDWFQSRFNQPGELGKAVDYFIRYDKMFRENPAVAWENGVREWRRGFPNRGDVNVTERARKTVADSLNNGLRELDQRAALKPLMDHFGLDAKTAIEMAKNFVLELDKDPEKALAQIAVRNGVPATPLENYQHDQQAAQQQHQADIKSGVDRVFASGQLRDSHKPEVQMEMARVLEHPDFRWKQGSNPMETYAAMLIDAHAIALENLQQVGMETVRSKANKSITGSPSTSAPVANSEMARAPSAKAALRNRFAEMGLTR